MRSHVTLVLVGAALFIAGVLFGIGGTVGGIVRLFSGVAESGTASPAQLAHATSDSLAGAVAGAGVAFAGLCLAAWGLIAGLAGRARHDEAKQSTD
jgi:hypothetical protein